MKLDDPLSKALRPKARDELFKEIYDIIQQGAPMIQDTSKSEYDLQEDIKHQVLHRDSNFWKLPLIADNAQDRQVLEKVRVTEVGVFKRQLAELFGMKMKVRLPTNRELDEIDLEERSVAQYINEYKEIRGDEDACQRPTRIEAPIVRPRQRGDLRAGLPPGI